MKKDNVLSIEVNNKNFKKILKNTGKYLKLCEKNNYVIKYIFNEEINNKEEFKKIEYAINEKDLAKRYSFIYDTVCDYIDKKYLDCNYCDFKDNVCIYFREHKNIEYKNGCCYADFRGGLCDHLDIDHCNIKSISCKLYSCETLRKKKIYFKLKDFLLIKYFFNLKQKYYIKYSFFKPKSYVMYKLIENYKNTN